MLADDLLALFRSDVVDTAAPYLWSDTEVWGYMNDAYRMFVRRIGGIPDTSSALTRLVLAPGQPTSAVSPLILRFRSAYLLSDGTELKIVNEAGLPTLTTSDYGQLNTQRRSLLQGKVTHMVTGMDRNAARGLVRWVRIPDRADTVQLSVQRLPLDTVEPGFEFGEIGEEHHEHLMLWMKARAYGKQDAECFDRGRRDEYTQQFNAYCAQAKAEWNRYKSHSMSVAYGGL
ncbi:hypothetical protein RF819_02745 [Rhodoferax fermentans]|uniref:Uncharacterized protein n=2 Tax=Rhodoferax fermentans TaxID=28066 RepID=A0A1T1AP00_RHOFE|nr:hypothetical protein RF819_02745 [Rhodoferax fermentans]